MFKKLLLLTATILSLSAVNMSAMLQKNDLKVITQELNKQQEKIINSLKHEAKLTAVAMGCHFTTLCLAHQMTKSMDSKEKALLGLPTILIGMYAGKTITNEIHGLMDTQEKHKIAQMIGLGSAFWLIDFLIKRNLI